MPSKKATRTRTKEPAAGTPVTDQLPRLVILLPGLPPGITTTCCERKHDALTARLAHGYTGAGLLHGYMPPHNRPCAYCGDPHPLSHEKDGSS